MRSRSGSSTKSIRYGRRIPLFCTIWWWHTRWSGHRWPRSGCLTWPDRTARTTPFTGSSTILTLSLRTSNLNCYINITSFVHTFPPKHVFRWQASCDNIHTLTMFFLMSTKVRLYYTDNFFLIFFENNFFLFQTYPRDTHIWWTKPPSHSQCSTS